MSKILFVVSRPPEINTSASIRNKSMLEGLMANGHEIHLLTTVPDRNHPAYDESLSVAGVHTIRIAMNSAQRLISFGRKNRMLTALKRLAMKWIARHEVYDHLKSIASHTESVDLGSGNYDCIISSSDPKSSHLFVLKLLEKQGGAFHGKWIQIWGDPFLADITQTSRNTSAIRAEEHRLLRSADLVFYVSELTLKQQQALYADCAGKMLHTPIPYMQERLSNNRRLNLLETIELVYCGDYSPAIRNLQPLYQAVNQNDRLHLVICGGSSNPLPGTDRVHVAGRVPYQTVQEVEDRADILVFVANRKGAQIPGKIYQYAGTNKPVLFILDGEADVLRAQFEGYRRFVFALNNAESIENAILEIISSSAVYHPLHEFSKEFIMSSFMQKL